MGETRREFSRPTRVSFLMMMTMKQVGNCVLSDVALLT